MILFALILAEPQHHHMMPGMTMPAPAKPKPMARPKAKARRSAAKPRAARPVSPMADHHAMPAKASTCSPEHAAMGHCRPASPPPSDPMPGMTAPACSPEHAAMGHCRPEDGGEASLGGDHGSMDRGSMDHGAMPGMAMADTPVGNAPPPPAPTTRAADRFYDPAAMAAADARMRQEHGGMRFSQILFNLAEIQVRDGRDGYRWDGEGWFGGDIHRLVVKTEGEGTLGGRIGAAEVQALYARAIDPYWNLQAGLRQDVGMGARRTYAVVGVEGLAPYWFDVEGALFLSDKGDLTGRAEAWVDQRLSQRAILQPRVEVNLAAQDVPDQRIAAGVSSIELGLRLRYEIAREFAPYVGVNWERRYGPAGGGGAALALGIRSWF
ncbi:MAG: copper resistance protein B [Sphingomonas pseudosanguinis]|uniref:copper resistance protein B n=1 Tax=Sphingomonas pseudosanguinis TaxID=413712 RepID=UPI00391BC4D8